MLSEPQCIHHTRLDNASVATFKACNISRHQPSLVPRPLPVFNVLHKNGRAMSCAILRVVNG